MGRVGPEVRVAVGSARAICCRNSSSSVDAGSFFLELRSSGSLDARDRADDAAQLLRTAYPIVTFTRERDDASVAADRHVVRDGEVRAGVDGAVTSSVSASLTSGETVANERRRTNTLRGMIGRNFRRRGFDPKQLQIGCQGNAATGAVDFRPRVSSAVSLAEQATRYGDGVSTPATIRDDCRRPFPDRPVVKIRPIRHRDIQKARRRQRQND